MTFPSDFSQFLAPRARRQLAEVGSPTCCFAFLPNIAPSSKVEPALKSLRRWLYPHTRRSVATIPRSSTWSVSENYAESLPKTFSFRSIDLNRRTAAHAVAERLGLIAMLRSEALRSAGEALLGVSLGQLVGLQAVCYERGDHVGPHNDHHPEHVALRRGYFDVHLVLTEQGALDQLLVHEQQSLLSTAVNVAVRSGIAAYRLPLWHYTTPLRTRLPGKQARRWVLMASFLPALVATASRRR